MKIKKCRECGIKLKGNIQYYEMVEKTYNVSLDENGNIKHTEDKNANRLTNDEGNYSCKNCGADLCFEGGDEELIKMLKNFHE